jgi:Ca2+/H+ antiporter
VDAAADAAAVEGADEDEEDDDEQAARAGATNRSGRASHVARLSLIVCILSIFGLMFGMSLVVGGR